MVGSEIQESVLSRPEVGLETKAVLAECVNKLKGQRPLLRSRIRN